MDSSQRFHRIVMIEDNRSDAALLRHALAEQREPFILEVLTDGEAALQFIRDHCQRCQPDPCLIVLDLHLPRYNGAAVLRALRSEPELADVKVVVLTTMASPAEKLEVLALGIHAYRTKPMNWEEMLELAGEIIAICNGPYEASAAGIA